MLPVFNCRLLSGPARESNTKLQDTIYFRGADGQSLYVNLFIPSTLSWPERKLVVRQKTDFPYADAARLEIEGGGRFELKVRVPGWATRGFFVSINGKRQAGRAVPGTYLSLGKNWRDKDVVEIRMPLGFSLDPVMDRPNLASVFYGPVLLAAEEPGPRTDWRPVTLDMRDIARSITGEPASLRFSAGDAALKPFFETYGRHSVYLAVTLK